MKLRRLSAVLGALALTFSATSAVLATAPVGHTVPVCHANSDEKEPYVLENPDISQVGYLGDTSGHAGHGNDGVWYPGSQALSSGALPRRYHQGPTCSRATCEVKACP
jgi:hypothetical protein